MKEKKKKWIFSVCFFFFFFFFVSENAFSLWMTTMMLTMTMTIKCKQTKKRGGTIMRVYKKKKKGRKKIS